MSVPTLSDDFYRNAATTFRDGLKLKCIMLKRGLTRAKAKCPECDGMLHGALVGSKKHMRFMCDGPCQRKMME